MYKLLQGMYLIFLLTSSVSSQTIHGEAIKHVLPKDAIPAIMEPEYVGGKTADSIMHPEEQVLGIVGSEGTALAYSTWHLDSHEIVNDRLDGTALAVTW